MKRRKRTPGGHPVLFPLAAVVIGLLAPLLTAEIAFRLLKIAPERYAPPRWLAWDGAAFREGDLWGGGLIKRPSPYEGLGVSMGEYVPAASFKVVYATNPRGYFDPDGGVPMTINSLGLRGGEVSRDKPPGTYRILGLGDSFTMGYGVRNEDVFLHRLQAGLNAAPPGSSRYEVLNAGVGGYNTRDEVVYLERRWLALDP